MSSQSILKWGNSLAFRIPSAIAKQMSVNEGATVTYRIVGRQLVVERAAGDLPNFTHADLIKALRKVKRQRIVEFGPPRGREIL